MRNEVTPTIKLQTISSWTEPTMTSFYFSLFFLFLSVVRALPVCSQYLTSLSFIELELARRTFTDAQLVIQHAAM